MEVHPDVHTTQSPKDTLPRIDLLTSATHDCANRKNLYITMYSKHTYTEKEGSESWPVLLLALTRSNTCRAGQEAREGLQREAALQ